MTARLMTYNSGIQTRPVFCRVSGDIYSAAQVWLIGVGANNTEKRKKTTDIIKLNYK